MHIILSLQIIPTNSTRRADMTEKTTSNAQQWRRDGGYFVTHLGLPFSFGASTHLIRCDAINRFDRLTVTSE